MNINIVYDIRCTKDWEESTSIKRLVVSKSSEIDLYKNKEPVLIKLQCSEIFYQMMISEKITQEDYKNFEKKIKEVKKS